MNTPRPLAERYRAAGLWTGQSLGDALREHESARGDRLAIVCGERRRTYAQLGSRIDRLAAGLHARGLRAGDRAVLHLPNTLEFFEVLGALLELGVAPVLALPSHRHAELGQYAAQTRAKLLVTAPGRNDDVALVGKILEVAPTVEMCVSLGWVSTPPRSTERIRWSTLDEIDDAPIELPPVPGSHVALFQLSGGSTGTPKLIPRTHDDYLYSIRRSVEVCAVDQDTTMLVALPVGHNFPLSSPGSLGVLLAGGRVILSPSPSPDAAFPLIERECVNLTAVVPPLLRLWMARAKGRGRTMVDSLQRIQVGGARLDPDLARCVPSALGCELQQVYGMAEGLVCYTRRDDPPDVVFHTQGRPMSEHDELRIIDEQGQDVREGEEGELLTRGPYTIRGYFEAPQHNAIAFTEDGFYRTGDLVRRTPQGNLVVSGRVKDQVNRGGEKIAAPEVEEALCSDPRIVQAAVVAKPDPFLGERSLAFIVVVSDPPPTLAEVRLRFTRLGLAAHKVPDELRVLSELPTTRIGKVDKRRLAALPPLPVR